MNVTLTGWRKLRALLVLVPAILAAQTTGMLNLYPANPAAEQTALNQAITEANGSSVDLTRALEEHLRKYPNSPRRSEIEASLYKTATDSGDQPRIVIYGEKILAGKPDNELEILDRVIRALLASGNAESAKQALPYVKRYMAGVLDLRARPPEGHATAAQWADLADRAFARAIFLDARASGILDAFDDAVAKANQAWILFPSAESAHEIAGLLAKSGRESEAIDHYADSAMIEDARSSFADRDRDRKLATDLYVRLHGSDQGLGDLFLKAWDRTALALRDRVARYRLIDPNYDVTDVFAFRLPAAGNARPDEALDMVKLKGRTVVVDFWATWCVPCIAQHSLIERVKQKYAQFGDVTFLSLNADDDHSLVAPFLKVQKWDQNVYLEAGLAGLLTVTSLPTILVIDPSGKVYSRITGFSTDSFERLLGTRIDEARTITAAK